MSKKALLKNIFNVKPLIGIGICIGLLIILSMQNSVIIGEDGIFDNFQLEEVRASVNHPTILISNNTDLQNFPNKTGNGTVDDPYIIEDLVINGGGVTAIQISNTNLFLEIRNCNLTGGYGMFSQQGGIVLWNCSNVNITGNFIYDTPYGIGLGIIPMVQGSSNNTISKNNITLCTYGIIIASSSSNNQVFENKIWNCGAVGMMPTGIAVGSSNNTVSMNSIWDCGGYGIEIYGSNITVSRNNITNLQNLTGIHVIQSSAVNISRNNIQNCSEHGIYLEQTNNTNISRNTVSNNVQYGIILVDEGPIIGNNIYLNDFYGNLVADAFSNTTVANNNWDNGTFGNYYGDYISKYPNASVTGFVWDTPYQIDSSTMYDNYPLELPYNAVSSPSVNFTANTTKIVQGDWVQFDFNGVSGNIPCSFEWDFGDISANSTERNPMHQYTTIGNYTVTLNVTDVDGESDVDEKIDFIEVLAELLPVSSFYVNRSVIIAGDSVQFTFNGSIGNGNEIYQWNFSDSTPIDPAQDPIHTFNNDGTYTPILTVTDFDGDSSTSSSGVQIIVLVGVNDEDGDGLSNYDEVKTHGTSPFSKDTDGDGYNDNIEIAEGTDPNDKDDYPSESDNFWDDFLKSGLLIPIASGAVGLVFAVLGVMIKRRMSKAKRKD
ncbi:MAG: PKD domain-containing protein [Candidatus Hodarchaeota archaeon]